MCEGSILSTISFPKKKAAAKCTQSRTITCGDNCTGCNPDELLASMVNENSEPGKDVQGLNSVTMMLLMSRSNVGHVGR